MRFLVIDIVSIFCSYFFTFSCFNIFFCFFPVYSHYKIFVFLRSIHFKQSIGLFCVVAREEKPSVRFAFTSVAQIEIYPWCFYLESYIHFTCFTHFYKTQIAFEVFFVGINWDITVCIIWRNAKTSSSYHIFCVFGDKWGRVISSTIWQLNNLGRSKSFQIKTCYSWCVIGIGKKPTTIHFTIGLRHFYVVLIIPRNKTV